MYKTINSFSPQAINICGHACPDAIEINCIAGLTNGDFSSFSISEESLNNFKYVSLHAPCHMVYKNDKNTAEVLTGIQKLCDRLQIELVVFHPDTIDDWSLFSRLNFPWAIENMDNRKKAYKDVNDLQNIFKKFNCGFVLDLNHCFSNDPTMKLAKKLINAFKNKIVEIHLSGFREYHELLCDTKQLDILQCVPVDINVPVILEGVCNDVADVAREYRFVKKYFL